jgi:hypothetical protein
MNGQNFVVEGWDDNVINLAETAGLGEREAVEDGVRIAMRREDFSNVLESSIAITIILLIFAGCIRRSVEHVTGIGYLQCDLMQMTAESSRNKNYQYGLVKLRQIMGVNGKETLGHI